MQFKDYASFKKKLEDTTFLVDRKDICRQYLLQVCSKVLGFKYDNKLRTLKEAISSLVELDNYLVNKKTESVWKYIESLETEVSRLQALEAASFRLNPVDLDLDTFKVVGNSDETAAINDELIIPDKPIAGRYTLLAHEDVLFKPVYVRSFLLSRKSKWHLGRKNIKGTL